jgi:hypothetical protein
LDVCQVVVDWYGRHLHRLRGHFETSIPKEMSELWGLLLLSPLGWESIDDHKGDLKHATDVYVRIGIAIIAGLTVYVFTAHTRWSAALLALAVHFFFFDYIVAYILEKNGVIRPGSHWFTYLGKSSDQDGLKPWVSIGPWGRLIVRSLVLVTSIYLYVK